MILEYHRPIEINEALNLLSRDFPLTIPLGGGNQISRKRGEDFAVVDLQNLALNKIRADGSGVNIGATATLQEVYENSAIPDELKNAVHLDAALNTRNTATMGGAIAAGTGQSAILTTLLAMDACLEWLPGNIHQQIGDYLSLRSKYKPGKLIVNIQIPIQTQVHMAAVGRSPMDPPFLIVAISCWPSGRTRVALGGKVKNPILAIDGTTPDGAVEAGINACSQLSNQWITENYLKSTISKLIQRLAQA